MYDLDMDLAPTAIEDVTDVEDCLNDADEDNSAEVEALDDGDSCDYVYGDFWGY